MKTMPKIEGMDTVITEGWLKEKSACKDGLAWAVSVIGKGMTVEDMLPHFERADWMLWLLKRSAKIDTITYVRIAIKCAESVIDIYEKRYPKDDRPRKAIEAAIAYVKEPSEANRKAADAAAAYSAASAASAAAAYAAASAAAYSAAAYAAASAAAYSAAAYAAASAAAYSAYSSAYAAASAAAYSAYSSADAAYSAAAGRARTSMHKKLCVMIIEELEGKR